MLISILGRQPDISIAELEAVFGQSAVTQITPYAATIDADTADISLLGGSTKIGRVIRTVPLTSPGDKAALMTASKVIVNEYTQKWRKAEHKITLGISAYNLKVSSRDVQKTGLLIKSALKKDGVSLRLIPNIDPTLSTATSHNNKLGLSQAKVELLIVKADRQVIIAQSLGSQNITAYTKRDHGKPKRDAFVGMLPPKLAQIMLNLALGNTSDLTESKNAPRLLDPFCGTGTVLQEALLKGYSVHGSDLSPKMTEYTLKNLNWLQKTHREADGTVIKVETADAMDHQWTEGQKINAVVCETYLGQPFSAPPSPQKLKEVVGNCNHIISEFLKNIHPQLRPNTPLCIAVPAWRNQQNKLTHLPLVNKLADLGYSLERPSLIYSRPDQVVTREILVLRKI